MKNENNKLWALLSAFYLSEFGGAGDDGGNDTGSGGGDDTAAGGGNDTTEGGSAPWYGDSLDDDLVSFVGDRDAKSMVEYAKSQRDAAGARVEKVIEEGGFIKPLGDGEEVGDFFQRFRPTEAADYGKAIGLDPEKATHTDSVRMEAAFAADIHPDQYKRFHEAEKIAQGEYAKNEAQKVVTDIQKDWGADAEKNGQAVDRVTKALGLSDGFADALSTPPMGVSGDDFRKILNGLKDMGLNMKEGGGPGNQGDPNNESQTLVEKRNALEQEIINQDGPATADQRRRQAELNQEISKEKAENA